MFCHFSTFKFGYRMTVADPQDPLELVSAGTKLTDGGKLGSLLCKMSWDSFIRVIYYLNYYVCLQFYEKEMCKCKDVCK